MRTVIIVSLGIVLALVFLAVGRTVPSIGTRKAAIAFTAVWTVAMVINMAVGMSHGYSFGEEFPILLMNVVPGVAVAFGGDYLLSRRPAS
ncbi:Integral membrane protein OS=Tsukamurella paurometabola (strain ATCC 8368 / DSM / CCUG 35730/ CIP 100753 / JCM 10117 / KCTC 9821 / NBRC 16120 / NCIMB 702349/ NCTC 13040) OX=521096 GN=Tpau_2181 PE=4 SV=1 [Tsukamurella paurometabola]|uniref:Integral membrane protein n=1 Tax=Tsukamurella paurometabola (strain ATCC 8368 / DSM 20162 / CCUG 35730 / CIP 100753 / JCM 10117 / KCTC 9821 / NBRC 16120 / NCIMB 702349 / NCTC 13040) TaxID=521096 RepID=D5UPN5_TSUPD|nr:hypothetical protein [Tsukamurella paurometabola]ADG78791.1 conserved hypothetical protein [Tsukamurella paurometabola DSM 20162]SUP33161.1 Uncharacterised protein [Tsukamurella paurometabola]